jgi:hypothetical protein
VGEGWGWGGGEREGEVVRSVWDLDGEIVVGCREECGFGGCWRSGKQ